eukprot:550488-Prymnesium_polylepis.1
MRAVYVLCPVSPQKIAPPSRAPWLACRSPCRLFCFRRLGLPGSPGMCIKLKIGACTMRVRSVGVGQRVDDSWGRDVPSSVQRVPARKPAAP